MLALHAGSHGRTTEQQVWWHMPVTPAFGNRGKRSKIQGHSLLPSEFEASLEYMRPHLNKTKTKPKPEYIESSKITGAKEMWMLKIFLRWSNFRILHRFIWSLQLTLRLTKILCVYGTPWGTSYSPRAGEMVSIVRSIGCTIRGPRFDSQLLLAAYDCL